MDKQIENIIYILVSFGSHHYELMMPDTEYDKSIVT